MPRYNKMVIGEIESVVQHVDMLGVQGFQWCLDTTKLALVN